MEHYIQGQATPHENLLNAIILQAAEDYRLAVISNDRREIDELEEFFNLGEKGKYILKLLKKELSGEVEPKKEEKPEWKIHEVCKKCAYRKILGGKTVRRKDDWSNTYCSYFEETGTLRDGKAIDDYCPNFKAKGWRK